MENQGLSAAHQLLHYLLTRAATTHEVGKASIKIPYLDLKDIIEEKDFEFEDVDLKVTIRLKWVSSDM